MWNVIGGFVISSIAEVFVKEIVKEIKKPGKTAVPLQEAPDKRLKYTKGQVMVLEWIPSRENAGKPGQGAVKRKKSSRRSTSLQQHE
jgi:hypothetical protein